MTVFGLYVLLVPFDNLLNTGSFGTITKLLGMVAGAFLLLWVVRRDWSPFEDPAAAHLRRARALDARQHAVGRRPKDRA